MTRALKRLRDSFVRETLDAPSAQAKTAGIVGNQILLDSDLHH
jgi:hypothetical protein